MSQAASLKVGAEPYPGYQLRRFLGRGGFGEVWEAVRPTGDPVALKFLPCGTRVRVGDESRSIQSVRQLRHPNLVRIGTVGCVPGYLVFAMELADGTLQDLYDVYQEELGQPISPDHLLPLLGQAAAGLDFLNLQRHHLGARTVTLQHGDVKPSNLLVFGETIKLGDFSLTAPVGDDRRGGTPGYMAPEIGRGRPSDRSDQYALAVTYCQLRGGRRPFRDSAAASWTKSDPPTPDLSMLPEDERPVVARALAPEPWERWRSCSELIDRLRRSLGLPPVAPELGEPGVSPAAAQERWAAVRLPSRLATSGRSLGTGGQSFSAVVQDIGRRGIGLVSDVGFGRGTILVLSLRGEEAGVMRPCYVRVARAYRRTDRGWFLGCTFAREFDDDEVRGQL